MASALTQHAGTTPGIDAPDRLAWLDWTKGALVLLMLLYHWLSYFVATEGVFYRYLRFVTPSFIFIAGFLISNVQISRYGISNPHLAGRLLRRGTKLLALFVALNVLATLLLRTSYSGAILFGGSVAHLVAVFVTGNVLVTGGKAAVFYILVPISYVLLLCSALVVVARWFRHVLQVSCLSFLGAALVIQASGRECANLELVAIGLLGVVCGLVPLSTLAEVTSHPYRLLVAYCCYLAAISLRDVTYPLLVAGVCLSLLILFVMSSAWDAFERPSNVLLLLGRYSLLGYIAQIAVLQALYRALRHFAPSPGLRIVSFCAAFALTILGVVVVDRARNTSRIADRLYRAVFA